MNRSATVSRGVLTTHFTSPLPFFYPQTVRRGISWDGEPIYLEYGRHRCIQVKSMTHASKTVWSSYEHQWSMIVRILLKQSLDWLRPGPAVREALCSLMSDGTKERLKCSVQHLGRRCFVAGSAHTAGGGRYVIWCETSGSRFSSDDTHSPPCTLWQALNNTHKPLAYLT